MKDPKQTNIQKKTSIAVAAAVGLAVLGSATAARALLPADADALWYSGLIENGGVPVEDEQTINVQLFDGANGQLCETDDQQVMVANGRFRVQLPAVCADSVRANAVFVDVKVGGVSLGRTRVGAVPYAIEADRADKASAASGALETRIAGLETVSGFLARVTAAQVLSNGVQPIVSFDSELFDSLNEYDPSTSTFTPTRAGIYDIGCNIIFGGPGTSSTTYLEAGIFVNGARIDVAAGHGDAYTQTFRARSLLPLAAGDAVTCRAYQNSGGTMPLIGPRPGEAVSSFSAVRLSS